MVVVRKPMNAPRLNALKTHCKHGHKFTPENTQWSVHPQHGGKMRGCAQCKRDRAKRQRERRSIELPSTDRSTP